MTAPDAHRSYLHTEAGESSLRCTCGNWRGKNCVDVEGFAGHVAASPRDRHDSPSGGPANADTTRGPAPYFTDGTVTLYLGDCREITAWTHADVLVTDPPYGIGWKRGAKRARGDAGHPGIVGDADTTSRDDALAMWGHRPAVVFGSFYAPSPAGMKHVLVYQKPVDAGVVGSTTGFRRDVDPVYLLGAWPRRTARWGSVVTSVTRGAGYLAARSGHPHAKPVDVMEFLIAACPPGVIADPFAGSGSTLVAARNAGRHAIGVEVDEAYCEIIARRLSEIPLFVGDALAPFPRRADER